MVVKFVDFIFLSLICRNEQSNEKIAIFCIHPMLDFMLSLQNNFRIMFLQIFEPKNDCVIVLLFTAENIQGQRCFFPSIVCFATAAASTHTR